MLDKSTARENAKTIRKNTSFDDRVIASSKIASYVLALDEVKRADSICVYLPIGTEVDTKEIIDGLALLGKKIYAPKTINDTDMVALKFESFEDCTKGNFNIPEPRGEEIAKEKLDLILVPMVAYNKNRARIGYGKGYYDRFIPKNSKTIGLAFSCQEQDFLPDSHDKTLDIIVTEKGVLR